jgi:pre-mycofactocin synthase
MANAWFETVAVAQGRARKRLPKSVYEALVAGSEKGVTARDNVAAFSELGFAPHVAGLSAQRDLSTTVMGQPATRSTTSKSAGWLYSESATPRTPD